MFNFISGVNLVCGDPECSQRVWGIGTFSLKQIKTGSAGPYAPLPYVARICGKKLTQHK